MITEQFFDLVTIGEGLALFREIDDSTVRLGKKFVLGTGGAESNVAIGVTRLGLKALWISSLGDDDFGSLVVESLAAQGVRTLIVPRDNKMTGHMIKFSGTQLDPTVFYNRKGSAASELGPKSIDWSLLPKTRLFHVSGVFAGVSSSSFELVRELMGSASRAGVSVSFDINYRRQLWSKEVAAGQLAELMGLADIVFGGEEEFSLVFNSEQFHDSLVEAAQTNNSQIFVVKRGAAGASSLTSNGWLDIEAHKISLVDTVGAGDAFVSGYLSEFLQDRSEEDRLAVANYCGAKACESRGDWEGMVQSRELNRSALMRPKRRVGNKC